MTLITEPTQFAGYDIPAGATVRFEQSVSIFPAEPNPWSGVELMHADDRVYVNGSLDVTDAYNAWLEKQPKTTTLAISWESPA